MTEILLTGTSSLNSINQSINLTQVVFSVHVLSQHSTLDRRKFYLSKLLIPKQKISLYLTVLQQIPGHLGP